MDHGLDYVTMLRDPRFLRLMHRLALAGALLMVVAPLISRWMQVQSVSPVPLAMQALVAMCHGQPPSGKVPAAPAHAGHAMPMDTAMPMNMSMDHGDGMPMPQGHDEAVCDYCVLAANLLPFVLALLLLPLLQPVTGRLLFFLTPPRARTLWPAHAARGPPLHA